jgi:hypothetical protein
LHPSLRKLQLEIVSGRVAQTIRALLLLRNAYSQKGVKAWFGGTLEVLEIALVEMKEVGRAIDEMWRHEGN